MVKQIHAIDFDSQPFFAKTLHLLTSCLNKNLGERRKKKESCQRDVLFGETVLGKSADEHGRGEDMNQSMMEASRKLQEAKRTVLDSEQIGLRPEWEDLRLEKRMEPVTRYDLQKLFRKMFTWWALELMEKTRYD